MARQPGIPKKQDPDDLVEEPIAGTRGNDFGQTKYIFPGNSAKSRDTMSDTTTGVDSKRGGGKRRP